jgi:thiamine biosynthesis lipoprotein ApbE
MGTVAAVSFKGAVLPALSEDVRKVYAQMENRLSAHNPDSEASRFRSLDEVVPETRACYKAAFNICEQSGGAFNPFWRGRDKGIDLGAIAKGFAVDVAAAKIDATVYSEGLLLDLGGNLKAVSGTWTTGIRDPDNPDGIIEKIILTNGMACATSGEYVRGKHIYDGRTGKPVDNNVLSVTVVHPTSAMLADGLSTTLFVLGREEGDAFLRRFYPEARAVWVMQNAVTK